MILQLHPNFIQLSSMPSSSSPTKPASSVKFVTQAELMKLKKEEQRIKTRIRMARLRERLKELTLEEQQAAKERARLARARYRDSHRSQLREHARDQRASKRFAAEQADDVYEEEQAKRREMQLEDSLRTRRAVRPRVPNGQGHKRRPTEHSRRGKGPKRRLREFQAGPTSWAMALAFASLTNRLLRNPRPTRRATPTRFKRLANAHVTIAVATSSFSCNGVSRTMREPLRLSRVTGQGRTHVRARDGGSGCRTTLLGTKENEEEDVDVDEDAVDEETEEVVEEVVEVNLDVLALVSLITSSSVTMRMYLLPRRAGVGGGGFDQKGTALMIEGGPR
ncbi:hypothetical protein C8F04DRAFT_1178281 [Mycena alexandri]|uniref:Uncharacterized protein n=1 Tax=Mycena alexandri TaxID=1745969 RepID=A0AAD6T5M2_9AGAR|nr:hypothetical protein C8F04DRAFT_1178281 [Mycena alexandri]